MPDSNDPALTVAVLCQHVLEEKDGTLSAIRIIDRITVDVEVDGPGDTELPPLPVNAVLLLIFKKDAVNERSFTASVTVRNPAGAETAVASLPLAIGSGPAKGANLIVRLGFGAKESGIYWFSISVDGVARAKVPLEILINKVTASTTSNPPAQTG